MKFSISTYNVNLSVGPPLRFNGAKERATRVADAFYHSLKQHEVPMPDFILLQELIVHRKTVINNFIHHPFSTPELLPTPFGKTIKLWPSGTRHCFKMANC